MRAAHQHQAALLVERISSHASVGKMSTGECSIPGGAVSVPQCIGVVNRTRRLSTSSIALTTVDRARRG